MKRCQLAVAVVLMVAVTSTAFAQQRGRRGFDRQGAAGLLGIEAVQNELKLTDEQKQKFAALREEGRNLRDLSQEERRQKLQEFAKKSEETVKTTLNDAQKKRLEEIRLQLAGPEALAQEEVAAKLGLEQAQKDKIKKIQEDSRPTEQFDFRNASQEDRQKYFAEARERREKTNAALLAVLTAAQKDAFEKLQGEKFEMPRRGRNRRNQDNG